MVRADDGHGRGLRRGIAGKVRGGIGDLVGSFRVQVHAVGVDLQLHVRVKVVRDVDVRLVGNAAADAVRDVPHAGDDRSLRVAHQRQRGRQGRLIF